jgi:hypothetical protein
MPRSIEPGAGQDGSIGKQIAHCKALAVGKGADEAARRREVAVGLPLPARPSAHADALERLKHLQFEMAPVRVEPLARSFDAGALVAIVGLRGSPMTGLPLSTAITREDFAFVSTLRVPRFPIAETATMNQSRHDQDDKSRLLQGLPSLAAQGAEARPARGNVMETVSCRARARRGAFGRLAMGL